ncbi:MAG: Fic family protein [Deltaproteobacteria bacterium]|nr:MAG: Fic family protein [Deltaproteobacteria bacterium]
MLHQLKAMTMGEPNEALLKQLRDEDTLLPEVLTRIAALHMGSTEANEPLRGTLARAGEQYFPHPLDVPPLLLYFLDRLNALWRESTSAKDDLYIAVFGMFGVLTVHPFEDANGRTSQDFAQYLLYSRWGCKNPPLGLHKNAHHHLGKAFIHLIEPCDGKSPEAFYHLRHSLATTFEQMTLTRLKENKNIALVANYLEQTLQLEWD